MIDRTHGTMDIAYYSAYKDCMDSGFRCEHRGGTTCIELRPYMMTITDPRRGLYTGATRRMNYRFWAAETLAYIAGWGGAEYSGEKYRELLVALNSNYANFSQVKDGVALLNPMVRYGDGFRTGLPRCAATLEGRGTRRQAVVHMGSPDTPHTYQDNPCLSFVQFLCEPGEGSCPGADMSLSMLGYMRSNDLGWGVPYDVASMCAVQLVMANSLGMRAGRYMHMAGSMHYYEAAGDPEAGVVAPGPPALPHYGKEHFYGGGTLRVPDGRMGNIYAYMATAHEMLLRMHAHAVVEGKTNWRSFRLTGMEHVEWCWQWAEIMRWRRPA